MAFAAALLAALSGQQLAERPAPKGGVEGRLTWFDRRGRAVATIGERGLYRTLALSPDGHRVAVERADPTTQNRDIWLMDASGGNPRRFTSDAGWDAFPLWSPDASSILFTSNRSGVYELYQKPVDGGEESLFYKSPEGKGPTSWSSNGRFLLFYSLGQPTHIRLLPASGAADRAATPIVPTPIINDAQFTSITPRFSPDGKWIAYTSNEHGTNEVSIRTFNSTNGSIGAPLKLSFGGGRTPIWRGDSKELYFLGPDGSVMAQTLPAPPLGPLLPLPRRLFQAPASVAYWEVTPDGERFLMPVPEP